MESEFNDLIEKRLKEARKKGEKRGIKIARLKMALSLLEDGTLSPEKISKICRLSVGLVKKMKSEWDY